MGVEELAGEARRRPEDPAVWCRLAAALSEHGHPGPAIEALERAAQVASDLESWLAVGDGFTQLEDRGAAARAYREATRDKRPAADLRALAHRKLAAALLSLGEVNPAVLTLRVAVNLAPGDADGHRLLAVGLLESGRLESALEPAERAVDLDFESAEAHRVLARVLLGLGRKEDAVETLRQVTVIAPLDVDAGVDLAAALAEVGQSAEAKRVLVRLDQRMDRNPGDLLRLGLGFDAAGDGAAAAQVLREVIRATPGRADVHLALGTVLERSGSESEALVAFQAAVGLDPASAPAHHRLGLALLAGGRLDEAIRLLVQASSLDPSSERIQTDLAAALRRRSPSPEGEGGEGSFTGDLAVFALPEVIEFLLLQRASGLLRVTSTEGAGMLELHRGQLAAARATQTATLARRLEATGLALPTDAPTAEDDARVARWLLDRGAAPRSLVFDHLERAVRDALANMVEWRDGQVRFQAMPEIGAALDEHGLLIDPRSALMHVGAARPREAGD